jgi:cytochrome c
VRATWQLLLLLCVVPACDDRVARAASATGGDPERGRDEAHRHGCGSCHTIPGVPGATTLVGPPLTHIAKRAYVAGTLPNTPDNLRQFVQHPQAVKPSIAMPEVPMSDADARDITAYLFTLE